MVSIDEQFSSPAVAAVMERLRVTGRSQVPWSWDSLDPDLGDSLAETLLGWVADYNQTYVVLEDHIVPRCWPAHPALAKEIAVVFSTWAVAFHSTATTSPDAAAQWLDKWLPSFQSRINAWLGNEPEACRAGRHTSGWNPTATKVAVHVEATPRTLKRMRDRGTVTDLMSSRSAPISSQLTGP